jgi:hypothetical protein
MSLRNPWTCFTVNIICSYLIFSHNLRYFLYVLLRPLISCCFLLNQTAAAEMENAVKRMEDEGVESYILDLRNNPVSLYFFTIALQKF